MTDTYFFSQAQIESVFNFARNMIGKHNPTLIMNRDDREIFRDDVRGKLGEIAVREIIMSKLPNAIITGDIDFSTSNRGIWDNYDLIVNCKYISVKAIKPQSIVLMIEKKRYDEQGNYVYKNNDGTSIINDFYVLVRVKIDPDITWDDLKTTDISLFLNPPKLVKKGSKWIKDGFVKRTFEAEVLGGISHHKFWQEKKLMPAGMKLTASNLNALLKYDRSLNNLPDKRHDDDKKNNILQVDNYAIHKDKLIPLKRLILS